MPYRYLRDNEYVTRAAASGARAVEGIRCRMSAMLLHDLAHANDFFSASRVAAMNPALSVLHVVVSGTIHSRLLANESRLQPQMMLGLVRVSFYGATATSVQEAHAPENVVGEFPLDQASDYYGHATTCEDYAMLFEETLMFDRFDIYRDVGIANNPIAGAPCADYIVEWCVRDGSPGSRTRGLGHW